MYVWIVLFLSQIQINNYNIFGQRSSCMRVFIKHMECEKWLISKWLTAIMESQTTVMSYGNQKCSLFTFFFLTFSITAADTRQSSLVSVALPTTRFLEPILPAPLFFLLIRSVNYTTHNRFIMQALVPPPPPPHYPQPGLVIVTRWLTISRAQQIGQSFAPFLFFFFRSLPIKRASEEHWLSIKGSPS